MAERNPRKDIIEYVDKQVGSRPEAVEDFLEGLTEASFKTADHLEANWGDVAAGKDGRKIAQAIERAREAYLRYGPPKK